MSTSFPLATTKNLLLAWHRIGTGTNQQHKRYFRNIYAAYAIALKENILALSSRLSHESYEPQSPVRIFVPKPSGLQRPLTLLCMEDQIVLQAIANIFAKKLYARRRKVELNCVFSNVLSHEKDNIFFLRDWHETYQAFAGKIDALFKQGLCWVGEFDLAAYYDTISHDLLLKTAFPRGGLGSHFRKMQAWFGTWSADKTNYSHGHGIPQGPIASDFLGESFFLPIDEKMGAAFKYLRYVDDVRLFGRSEREVQKAAIELEVVCRNRGLIPQAKKCGIRRVTSTKDVLQFIPSLVFNDGYSEEPSRKLSARKSILELRKSLGGRPLRIQDKARARYALYRGTPSTKLLRYILALISRHPEHIDSLFFMLSQFPPNRKTKEAVGRLIRESPYQYIRGESWLLLALLLSQEEMMAFVNDALTVARNSHAGFSESWGACAFLCYAEQKGLGKYSRWLFYKPPLLQALLAQLIPKARYAENDVMPHIIKRSAIEPGLAATSLLVHERVSLKSLGIKPEQLSGTVHNVYRKIGLIRGRAIGVEPIAELLARSVGVTEWDGWKRLVAKDYRHACQILAQAVPVIDSNRSLWLINQNSFNNAVFIAFQKWLDEHNMPGTVALTDQTGKLKQFGQMLNANNQFSRLFPTIADAFRALNNRRNTVPEAHPYKRTGKRTEPLRAAEQKGLITKLKGAFDKIEKLVG